MFKSIFNKKNTHKNVYGTFEYISHPVLIVNKSGVILYANKMINIFGYNPDEVQYNNLSDIIDNYSIDNHVYITDTTSLTRDKHLGLKRPLTVKHKNGDSWFCEINISIFENNILLMVYDTDKTKNNSVKLKDYQYFFDKCLDMFFVTSLEGYFIKAKQIY